MENIFFPNIQLAFLFFYLVPIAPRPSPVQPLRGAWLHLHLWHLPLLGFVRLLPDHFYG